MEHRRAIRESPRGRPFPGKWVAVMFLCAWAIPTPAAGLQAPGSVAMHRQQAGTPNQMGWYDAKSTQGHFSVSLPIPFNDFTVRVQEKEGRETVSYVIGSTSKEGFKFSATEIPRGSMTRDFDLKGYGGKLKANPRNTVSGEKFFDFSGHPAVQFQVSDGQKSAFMRAVVFRSGVVLLIVECPAQSERDAVPLVAPFFDSLKVAQSL